jgi:hypothetical protein
MEKNTHTYTCSHLLIKLLWVLILGVCACTGNDGRLCVPPTWVLVLGVLVQGFHHFACRLALTMD